MRLARRLLPLGSVALLGALGMLTSALLSRPAGSAAPPLPTLPPEAGLAWDVRDAETGAPIPCKLTLLGTDGTPRPTFTRGDIGREEGPYAVAAYNRLFAVQGQGVARVPFGTYDVYVSRGPEWDLHVERKVKVGPRGAQVFARLRHVVDTHGWISADLHVHSAASSDSRVPLRDRVHEFVSDGVEVIVATDHNVVSDYAPIIQELGVGKYLTSISGDELTTGSWGHFGVFPLMHDRDRSGHGAIHVHGRTAAEFFKSARELSPDVFIDVHHPRIDNEIGYFNLARFDASRDRAGRPGWSLDFDGVEVLNGYQDSERRSVDRVIADWWWLLDHGHVVTATGNSDTHHLTYNLGGYPRNYIRVTDDTATAVTPSVVARALKAHRSLFTTAPFVRLRADGAEVGETIPVRGGKVKVQIEVQAAPWVSVTRAVIYLSGKEARRFVVPASQEAVRLAETFDLPVPAGDAWILARVDGDRPLSPVVGDEKKFDVRPFAMTNPIFLDTDGNGVFDAPLRGK